ncbi:FAD-binding protein [Ancylomarina euxinus]|uniref:FAD-binding protein n=1 Tax=Ancylomarina euxinus TaxID=2283627 RepID=A0A425Y712_9BACT|nr:FAD-dependent oxidoreductase [Ancylomarina euxinus]MCZ4693987.1 FAD-dependent oxidoreductase [Ancylomarina euxinus]MUP14592.1 FAD-binding protein [Ancylomarina euxinus]RRG24140.1 FAD-binding protein [Ancylomarina euxinus]
MITEINLVLSPREASEESFYKPLVANNLKIYASRITGIQILRRSIDARQRNVKINMRFRVAYDEDFPDLKLSDFSYQDVSDRKKVIVVGAGPAGLFAALRLIELGYCPIVLERGKRVEDRKKDLAAIHKNRTINPDSNYSFGEGGAGTFSDGKLYTRSKKRGNLKKILEVLHFHGAQEDILIDAHPHIGTDVLPKVIVRIRESIIQAGGEVHFSTKVNHLLVSDNKISGVRIESGDEIKAEAVILATGHSARDIYYLLDSQKITIEAKTFAVGVRIEHSQNLIDQIQYHNPDGRGEYLPAASYSFVQQVDGRGVYSFCMCPGGVIVPAATGNNQQVVNGMSSSRRNTAFANSGMAVEVMEEDLKEFEEYGALAGIKFQEKIEALAFEKGGSDLTAPAQCMYDFVKGIRSSSLPQSSYQPGLKSSALHEWLPKHISYRLQEGFKAFGNKSKGFLTNEAVILAVESRTSSPVRIPRDNKTLQHIQVSGLFPCGEGAGYAGGIVSAAMDGERCAEAFHNLLLE